MTRRFSWLVWVLVANLVLAVGAVGAETAWEPQWLLRTELQLQNIGTTTMNRAIVEMPLIVEDSAYGLVVSEQFNAQLQDIVVLDCGTRKGIFRIGTLKPGESFTIRLEYFIDPDASLLVDGDEVVLPSLPPPDSAILDMALEVAGDVEGDENRFAALQRFTHQHMSYSLDSEWRNGGALQALHQAEGVCEDYAELLVALANALDIPSRTVYGYVFTPRSERWIRHAWVEYLSEDGYWQGTDPTFSAQVGLNEAVKYLGQGYSNLSARVRFVGGRLAGLWQETVEELEEQKSH